MKNPVRIYFWSNKNSGEELNKLKARDFNATSLSTYDFFSNFYTTLSHNLIKDKLVDLIERTFHRKCSPYLVCNNRNAFSASEKPKKSCMVLSKYMWCADFFCLTTFILDLALSCINK